MDDKPECRYCGEEIRPVAAGDGIDPQYWDFYAWVSTDGGGALCDMTPVHEPKVAGAEPDWPAIFGKYAAIVGRNEGVDFLDASEWTAEEWAAIVALPGREYHGQEKP